MTKSTDHKHASPSSSLPAYVFGGPAQVAIRTRTNDQPRYVDTRLIVWAWYDGGVELKIDWAELDLTPEFNEIAQGFIAYALEKYAPQTAFMFARSLVYLSSTNLARYFPWDRQDLTSQLEGFKRSRHNLIGFRRLYRWAVDRGIKGFDLSTYLIIKDTKSARVDPYARIFLSQSGFDLDVAIESILLATPPAMNGKERWLMEQLTEIAYVPKSKGAVHHYRFDVKEGPVYTNSCDPGLEVEQGNIGRVVISLCT